MNQGRDWRSYVRAAVIAAAALLVQPQIANAAWLGYRNNTPSVVVIQSAVVVNNQLRWGKPHTLFPGEVAWDAAPAPGARIIGVFDPKQNNRLVYQETVAVASSDIFLSLQMISPPVPRGQGPLPAVPRFIAVPLPTAPPGGVAPKPGAPTTPGAPKITPPSTSPPKAPGNPPTNNPPSKPGG